LFFCLLIFAFVFARHVQQYLIKQLRFMFLTFRYPHQSQKECLIIKLQVICWSFSISHSEVIVYQQDTSFLILDYLIYYWNPSSLHKDTDNARIDASFYDLRWDVSFQEPYNLTRILTCNHPLWQWLERVPSRIQFQLLWSYFLLIGSTISLFWSLWFSFRAWLCLLKNYLSFCLFSHHCWIAVLIEWSFIFFEVLPRYREWVFPS
jgi:hypothetical protein